MSRRTGCFSPEELQLQLCRTCHPSTRDLLDKALPSYEDHCEQNFQLLSNVTPITGDEPALRLSPLHGGYQDPPGALNMPSTLPSYSVRPEYMPADTHCALCFHVCPMPSPPLESRPEHRGVHPAVVAHAQEYHGLLDADAYRRAVLARVQVEWPVPVSAQVQRMSVDRYLDRLRDDNYTTSLCACCACVEFSKDLMECEFPLRSCPQKPSWVMVDGKRWSATSAIDSAGQQTTFGEAWFDKVKDLLDVASYEDTYFEIPQRLAEAEAWSSATPACTPDQIHSLWLGRVRTAMCITTASHQL